MMSPTLMTESIARVPIFGIVISPATTAMFDFTRVSHATRLCLSSVRQASSTLSEMRSATLSGCPSPTDSEEKTKELAMREGTGGGGAGQAQYHRIRIL